MYLLRGLCSLSHVPSRWSLSSGVSVQGVSGQGVSVQGVFVRRPSGITKAGGTNSTGMLSCYSKNIVRHDGRLIRGAQHNVLRELFQDAIW